VFSNYILGVLYVSWTIVHGRRLSTGKINFTLDCPYFMDIIQILWAGTIFDRKFFQNTVHKTWPIYNLICFIHIKLNSFGTLLKFSLKLCVEFLGNSLMHIWQRTTEKIIVFIFHIHYPWNVDNHDISCTIFPKKFNLIIHGHGPNNMDIFNIIWTI